jgi:geranylgeranyl diphosphate synthase type 3
MINLHHGQGFDIFWRDHQICPTEEEYKKMVLDSTHKPPHLLTKDCCPLRWVAVATLCCMLTWAAAYAETGGLFRLAVKLMQAFSKDQRCISHQLVGVLPWPQRVH